MSTNDPGKDLAKLGCSMIIAGFFLIFIFPVIVLVLALIGSALFAH